MQDRELTLSDFINVAIKRIWILIIAAVIGGLVAMYYSNFLVVPKYRSSSKFYVDTQGTSTIDATVLDQQRNTAYARMIVGSYLDIFQTYNFSKYLADNIDSTELSKEYDYIQLYKAISYDYTEDTESFTVTVVADTPEDAYVIAQSIQDEAESYLVTMKPAAKGTIKVIDNARLEKRPINLRTSLNVLLGAFLCAVIAFIIVFIIEINDVRIKSEKEVSEIFGLPILGSIPEYMSTGSENRYGV